MHYRRYVVAAHVLAVSWLRDPAHSAHQSIPVALRTTTRHQLQAVSWFGATQTCVYPCLELAHCTITRHASHANPQSLRTEPALALRQLPHADAPLAACNPLAVFRGSQLGPADQQPRLRPDLNDIHHTKHAELY